MIKEWKKLLGGGTLFALGLPEIFLIGIVIVALFFGGKKLNEWARGLGRFSSEFKRGKLEAERELAEAEKQLQEMKSKDANKA